MRKFAVIFILLIFFVANISKAQDPKDRFKGLYMFNITKLIDWPESYKDGNFVVTILGQSTVDEGFTGKQVINQPIVAKKINSLDALGKTHILFIPQSESQKLGTAIEMLEGKPTVIITDQEGLLDKGAFINFIMKEGKLGIEINKTSMEKSGLKVSSDLLSLASKVK